MAKVHVHVRASAAQLAVDCMHRPAGKVAQGNSLEKLLQRVWPKLNEAFFGAANLKPFCLEEDQVPTHAPVGRHAPKGSVPNVHVMLALCWCDRYMSTQPATRHAGARASQSPGS